MSFSKWLSRLWGKPLGYWCDGCHRWAKRRDGKALVHKKADGVKLYCPDCAETILEAERQLKPGVVIDDPPPSLELAKTRARALEHAFKRNFANRKALA